LSASRSTIAGDARVLEGRILVGEAAPLLLAVFCGGDDLFRRRDQSFQIFGHDRLPESTACSLRADSKLDESFLSHRKHRQGRCAPRGQHET
jgi:hypothetical protein